MEFDKKELYKNLFEKAAAYFDSCVTHHIFIEGNKRTTLVIATRFLFLNGNEFCADNNEAERFVLKSVTKKYPLKVIAALLKKIKKNQEN